jgi:beta-glucosidase
VRNGGARAGAAVPQLYVVAAPAGERRRLLGFEPVVLEPGESRRVTIVAEPRLVVRYDGCGRIAGGSCRIAVAAPRTPSFSAPT